MAASQQNPSRPAQLQPHRSISQKFNSSPSSPDTGRTKSDRHFQHPAALVDQGVTIGPGTRVWAFAHIATGATVGEDCNICDHAFIEGGVRLGDRVTVKCGVYLWHGLTVEDDVFIGPSAAFTNDYRPRSKRYLPADLHTLMKEGCSIGANSTVLPNLTIGRWAMVGAGSVVTKSIPDFALVVGNPARFRAWICRCGEKLPLSSESLLGCKSCSLSYELSAKGQLMESGDGFQRHTMA